MDDPPERVDNPLEQLADGAPDRTAAAPSAPVVDAPLSRVSTMGDDRMRSPDDSPPKEDGSSESRSSSSGPMLGLRASAAGIYDGVTDVAADVTEAMFGDDDRRRETEIT